MAKDEIKDEEIGGGQNSGTELEIPAQAEIAAYALPNEAQIAEYKKFLQNYEKFVNEMLKDGIDYGVIPGVEKPTLLKPGAEKLEKFFFLRSKKVLMNKEVSDGGKYISYTYQTNVFNRAGQIVATCEGTCNSKEKKYRWTTVFDNQATEEQKAAWKLEVRKSRAGKEYKVYVIEKTDCYDLENTIMKMAQKRSYVGAILEATNSSSRFTQDVEDMDIIDYGEHSTPAKAAAAETGKKIDPLFEKAKKNLAANTDKEKLADYRKKIEASTKYTPEQKAELFAIIDKLVSPAPAAAAPAAPAAEAKPEEKK